MPNAAPSGKKATPLRNPLIPIALVGIGVLMLGGYWRQAKTAQDVEQSKQSAAAVKNQERSVANKRLYDAIVQGGDAAMIRAAADDISPDYLVSLFNNIIREGQTRPAQSMLPTVMAVRPESGNDALSTAASYGYTEIVRALLKAGVKPNGPQFSKHLWPPLIRASMFGQVDTVRVLLDSGANINAVVDPADRDSFAGMTPLMAAADCGYAPTLKLLISRGAKVNYRNPKGPTALALCRHFVRSRATGIDIALPERAKVNLEQARQSINRTEAERLLVKAGAKE